MGKDGLDIPPQVLDGPLAHDTILSPGDVLYMPRGFVHQAKTMDNECSFHVTVALPTHDWTLAGAVAVATQQALLQVVEYRMAMPLSLFSDKQTTSTCNTNNDLELVQQQLDEAWNMIREQVNLESIVKDLRKKAECHNFRAEEKRMAILQRQVLLHCRNGNTNNNAMIGKDAASTVTLDTILRASTDEERTQVVLEQPRGLNVREDTADSLLGVLQQLKANPSRYCRVSELLSLLTDEKEALSDRICQLTLVSFARCCVELGGMTIVVQDPTQQKM